MRRQAGYQPPLIPPLVFRARAPALPHTNSGVFTPPLPCCIPPLYRHQVANGGNGPSGHCRELSLYTPNFFSLKALPRTTFTSAFWPSQKLAIAHFLSPLGSKAGLTDWSLSSVKKVSLAFKRQEGRHIILSPALFNMAGRALFAWIRRNRQRCRLRSHAYGTTVTQWRMPLPMTAIRPCSLRRPSGRKHHFGSDRGLVNGGSRFSLIRLVFKYTTNDVGSIKPCDELKASRFGILNPRFSPYPRRMATTACARTTEN